MLHTKKQEDVKAYKEQKRKSKSIYKQVKRAYYEDKLRKVEENYKGENIKNFYQEIKSTRQGRKEKALFCKGKDGKLIENEVEATRRWTDYYKEILNSEKGSNKKDTEKVELYSDEDIEAPTKKEIEEVVSQMKNGKSPGENGISTELIKYGGKKLISEVHKLIAKI